MRVFVGIDIPVELKENIYKLVHKYLFSMNCKPVEKENLHITLKFYGDVTPSQLEIIKNIIDETCAQFSPFEVIIKGIGAFPSEFSPRVLWLDVKGEGRNILKQMFVQIEAKSLKYKLRREEHEYTPHLTIARIKSPNFSIIKKMFDEFKDYEFGRFVVKRLTIFKSTLTPRGPIYEKIAESEL